MAVLNKIIVVSSLWPVFLAKGTAIHRIDDTLENMSLNLTSDCSGWWIPIYVAYLRGEVCLLFDF